MAGNGESHEQLERFVKRDQKLRRWTWLSLVLPLGIFVVLAVMASKELARLTELEQRDQALQKQIEEKEKALAKLQEQEKVSQLASGAVRDARPAGTFPRIIYFRDSERDHLQGALKQLGVTPDVQSVSYAQGENPKLAGKPVDTLAYGCAVSEQDLRLIAAALIKAGVPIRRITPAEKKPDPLLVQVIASAKTDSNGPSLDPAQVTISAKRCPPPKANKAVNATEP